jgi:hypothetical protein
MQYLDQDYASCFSRIQNSRRPLSKVIDCQREISERCSAQHHHSDLWVEIFYRDNTEFASPWAGLDKAAWDEAEPGTFRDQRQMQIVAQNVGDEAARCVCSIEGTLQSFSISAPDRVHDPAIWLKVANSCRLSIPSRRVECPCGYDSKGLDADHGAAHRRRQGVMVCDKGDGAVQVAIGDLPDQLRGPVRSDAQLEIGEAVAQTIERGRQHYLGQSRR